VGYRKNPFALLFNRNIEHRIGDGRHEVERLHDLIGHLQIKRQAPKLYPSDQHRTKVKRANRYVTIAPASVWHTKQWPAHKWTALIQALDPALEVVLIGAPNDQALCDSIAKHAERGIVLAGQLNLLESAALIEHAEMNYVNDSAPLHLASAMNAPVTAVFCCTIPAYGFGPTHASGRIVEITENLACRSCGLHGKRACPEGHFKCAESIRIEQVLA